LVNGSISKKIEPSTSDALQPLPNNSSLAHGISKPPLTLEDQRNIAKSKQLTQETQKLSLSKNVLPKDVANAFIAALETYPYNAQELAWKAGQYCRQAANEALQEGNLDEYARRLIKEAHALDKVKTDDPAICLRLTHQILSRTIFAKKALHLVIEQELGIHQVQVSNQTLDLIVQKSKLDALQGAHPQSRSRFLSAKVRVQVSIEHPKKESKSHILPPKVQHLTIELAKLHALQAKLYARLIILDRSKNWKRYCAVACEQASHNYLDAMVNYEKDYKAREWYTSAIQHLAAAVAHRRELGQISKARRLLFSPRLVLTLEEPAPDSPSQAPKLSSEQLEALLQQTIKKMPRETSPHQKLELLWPRLLRFEGAERIAEHQKSFQIMYAEVEEDFQQLTNPSSSKKILPPTNDSRPPSNGSPLPQRDSNNFGVRPGGDASV
jgi:hypothetical protein